VIPVAKQLFATPRLTQLLSLSMSECNLKDEHMKLFSDSPYFSNLIWLSVRFNNIGMVGAEHLVASKLLPKLRYVDFYLNEIDPTDELLDDGGIVLGRKFSEAGRELESRYGEVAWFHPEATLTSCLPPSRFTLLDY
jgi:hypothetical protein